MKYAILFIISCFCLPCAAIQQPEGSTAKDDYWTMPQKPYQQRRLMYLNYCAANSNEAGRDGVFPQIARLELGLPVNEDIVRKGIAVVYQNRDCNDFTVGGLVRLYYINVLCD